MTTDTLQLKNLRKANTMLPGMLKVIILLAMALLLNGCSSKRPLMPTPDVYALGIQQPFADNLPAELRTVDANILYVTDRIAAPRDDGRHDYGLGRAHSLAVGEAVVNIGGDISWEELAADARSGERPNTLNLGIKSVSEKVRGPTDAMVYYEADGNLTSTEEGKQMYQDLISTSHEMMRKRLATAPRNEIVLFVHGVNQN